MRVASDRSFDTPRIPVLRVLVAIALALAAASAAYAQESAIYEVRLRRSWEPSDLQEGIALPEDAHFTALIGATHPAGLPLWEPGGLASPGTEEVAEVGFVGTLVDEIDERIARGDAGEFVEQGEFVADLTHSSVSALSMAAPSPDWFVGVSDLSLHDGQGWIDRIQIDLRPWDAGTEGGSAFQLEPNPDTVPHEPIALRGYPFVESAVIGRLTFTFVPEPGSSIGGAAAVAASWRLHSLRRRRRAKHRSS